MHPLLVNAAGRSKRVFTSLWKFFAGGIVVLVAFTANFFDLKQPSIGVEITEIEQITSAEVDVSASPYFQNFRKLGGGDISVRILLQKQMKTSDMVQTLERAKQRLADLKEGLVKRKQDFEKREKPDKETPGMDLPSYIIEDTDIGKLPYETAKKAIAALESKIQEQTAMLASAEAEVRAHRERSEKTDAKIIVTAAISNSGDGSTTLKPQALLRTDLGQGNYLDINLRIVDYEKGAAEIKARGTNVLKFESQPISKMAPQDQERFVSFFRNTSPTNLFVVDVKERYRRSNTIPFAQGIYEQKIFDGLKGYASMPR